LSLTLLQKKKAPGLALPIHRILSWRTMQKLLWKVNYQGARRLPFLSILR